MLSTNVALTDSSIFSCLFFFCLMAFDCQIIIKGLLTYLLSYYLLQSPSTDYHLINRHPALQ